MPGLWLNLTANGLVLLIAVIGWGLENRWHDQRTKTRRRWARVLILLLIAASLVDGSLTLHKHGQEQEERERAERIDQGVQTLVKLARERDPTLTEQEALKEVGAEIQVLRGRTSELERELEGVKRYGSVALLNMVGTSGKAGEGLTEENSVLPELENAFNHEQRDGKTHVSLRCDEAATEIFRRAIEVNPDFPFSHFALAICTEQRGEEGWQGYAEKAVEIFEHTTEIAGHHENHDWALNGLREILNLQEQEEQTVQ